MDERVKAVEEYVNLQREKAEKEAAEAEDEWYQKVRRRDTDEEAEKEAQEAVDSEEAVEAEEAVEEEEVVEEEKELRMVLYVPALPTISDMLYKKVDELKKRGMRRKRLAACPVGTTSRHTREKERERGLRGWRRLEALI